MRKLLLWVGLFTLAGGSPAGATASFMGLGGASSEATAISADGSVVVGQNDSRPFRWTRSGGLESMPLPGSGGYGRASDVSADGSVIVANTSGSEPVLKTSYRWTQGGGWQDLGHLWTASNPIGGNGHSIVFGVSGDGSVAVGESVAPGNPYFFDGFRWTVSEGIAPFRGIVGGNYSVGRIEAVSEDGSVMTGVLQAGSGFQAFRWTESGGIAPLFSRNAFYTYDYYNPTSSLAISDDGSAIVGASSITLPSGSSAIVATLWTDTSVVSLGDLPGGSDFAHASAVSADGSVVVGRSSSLVGEISFVWDQVNGMRSLRQLLGEQGIDMTGWSLTEATGISANGLTIVGNGINPLGESEAWIATIVPEPSTALLLGLGLAGISARRRV